VVTSFALLARRVGSTEAEFRSHWRDVHAPLVGRVDYLRGYVQHRTARVGPGPHVQLSSLDGIAEFWWDDRAAALRPHSDPRYTAFAQPDEPRFLDMTRLISVQTVPVCISESARAVHGSGASALMLLVRPTTTGADEFAAVCQRAWRRAVDTARGTLDRCVLHLVEHDGADDPPPVDAIVACRWRDAAAQRAWQESSVVNDGRDQGRSRVFMTDEHVVLAPPGPGS
jgi:heme-degrading monooxygenase HmoA